MSNQAERDKYICKRKDCTFYGSVQNGTCNYRLIAKKGRGTSIPDCDKYTTAPFEDRRKDISINPPTENPDTKTPKGAKKEMPKTYDWITIFGRLSAGEDLEKLKAEYGFSDSAYNNQLRKRKSNAPPEGGNGTESAVDTMPERTPAQDENVAGSAGSGAEQPLPPSNAGRPSKDPRTGVSNFRWYSQDLMRIADIADTLTEEDSLKLYRSYSKVMQEIISEMCETRLREVGAFDRAMKERQDGVC